MELIKINSSDIFQDIKGDIASIYNLLVQNVPNNPFAEMKAGIGFYVWTTDKNGWTCITHADELETNIIYAILGNEKRRIGDIPGYHAVVDKLFTYPDENYVFFRYTDDNNIEIKIAGWGYKKSLKPRSGGPIVTSHPTHVLNPITIAFYKGGERLPHREFGVILANKTNIYQTDEQGLYCFSHISIGKTYEIVDTEMLKHFTLQVEADKHQYDFVLDKEETHLEEGKNGNDGDSDGAQLVKAHIKVVGDNNFVETHYPLTICIYEDSQDVTTDEEGIYSLPELPVGSEIEVTDGLNTENIQNFVIEIDNEEYLFYVQQEKEPEEHIKCTILDWKSSPIQCEKIRFHQDNTDYEGVLDEKGTIEFSKDLFSLGSDIEVNLVGASQEYPSIKFKLDEEELEYILQEHRIKEKDMNFISIMVAILWFLLVLGTSAGLVAHAYGLGLGLRYII